MGVHKSQGAGAACWAQVPLDNPWCGGKIFLNLKEAELLLQYFILLDLEECLQT